ncbi:MAG: dihydroneopterin aldolase [Gammaproteobacteria bacterium]
MPDIFFPGCYRLLIQDIEIDCYLGVYEHEQARARPLVIEVEMYVPEAGNVPRRDDLSETVNYERVVESIERVVGTRRFKLVETLCGELADELVKLRGLRALKVSVTKPQPLPRAKAVRVELWRQP